MPSAGFQASYWIVVIVVLTTTTSSGTDTETSDDASIPVGQFLQFFFVLRQSSQWRRNLVQGTQTKMI